MTAETDASFGVLKQVDAGVLSVGYAEGLIDALSFTGEVNLSW